MKDVAIGYFDSLGLDCPKARFSNSRLCRFKFLEATVTIIWKRSSDQSGRSLRQKRSVVRDRLEFYPCDREDRKRLSSHRLFFNGNQVQTMEATEALGHIPWSTRLFTSRPYTSFKVAASNSNNTSTFIEEIQRYECLYNKLSKDYKNRRTRENAWETIGQKFGLNAEAVPKTDAFLAVLSSSQNIT